MNLFNRARRCPICREVPRNPDYCEYCAAHAKALVDLQFQAQMRKWRKALDDNKTVYVIKPLPFDELKD